MDKTKRDFLKVGRRSGGGWNSVGAGTKWRYATNRGGSRSRGRTRGSFPCLQRFATSGR